MTPRKIAQKAIENLAEKRLVHRDIEWRHIALLPVIDEENQVITKLLPIFIDLTSVTEVETVEMAREEMMQRLEEMSEGYNW